MRKINKNMPLPNFNGANYNNSCRTWSDFHENHKKIYEDTRLQILTNEQNQLCGYTEIYINELKSCHIDHYKKRSMFPQLTFEWNNLIAATKDNEFGAIYKDNNSGIQANEYTDIFNPVIDDVEHCFDYTAWGEVIPKNKIEDDKSQKAKNTIDVFNLNHNSLKERRKNFIRMINSYKEMAKTDILCALENFGFVSLTNEILE